MSELKLLRDKLLGMMDGYLKPYGFKRQREQEWMKTHDWGKAGFHIGFIPHPGIDFDLTANVEIRLDAVEDLFHKYGTFYVANLSPKKKKNTFTMGAEIGNITIGRNKRWTVATWDDLVPVADGLLTAFKEVALPYYEKYSNMRNALELLSGDDRNAGLNCAFNDKRAMVAVALAWILKDPRINELVENKRSFLARGLNVETDVQQVTSFLKRDDPETKARLASSFQRQGKLHLDRFEHFIASLGLSNPTAAN